MNQATRINHRFEPTMKFGLFYLPTYLPSIRDAHTHLENIVQQVQFADRIGIDYVWMVEHHFVRHGGLCAANYALLSYLAACTQRIRLGTGATVLPLNDPIRVAEQAATLDHLSKGRFDFGTGRGFLRVEFDAFGVPMRESRERVEEGIEVVKQAWTGGPIAYNGRFRPHVENLPILPPAYQKPHPPIWVACFLSPESFVWTAEQGYNLLYVAYHVSHQVAAERVNWYRDALRAKGRSIDAHEICSVYHAHFTEHDDIDKLRAKVEQPMGEYLRAGAEASPLPPDPQGYKGYDVREEMQRNAHFNVYFPERVVMGGPNRVIDRIAAIREMGVTQIGMLVDFGSLAQTEIMRSLEIFAERVLPQVRDL